MYSKHPVKEGALHAALAALYIVFVVFLMSNVSRIFGTRDGGFIEPVCILSLLVVSAAVMAMIVFGEPVMLYIDGKKREAMVLVGTTIGCFAAFTALMFVLAFITHHAL